MTIQGAATIMTDYPLTPEEMDRVPRGHEHDPGQQLLTLVDVHLRQRHPGLSKHGDTTDLWNAVCGWRGVQAVSYGYGGANRNLITWPSGRQEVVPDATIWRWVVEHCRNCQVVAEGN